MFRSIYKQANDIFFFLSFSLPSFLPFFSLAGVAVYKQVALHRSLTSLLHVAEMRPVNWRRYCATSPSPSKVPPAEGAAAARAAASVVEEQRSSGEGALPEQLSTLPPVCVLFALCEKGRGGGAGASELQPLIWQLLELTLRPEGGHPAGGGAASLPLAPSALESLLRKGGSADGGSNIGVDSNLPPGTHEGGDCSPPAASSSVAAGRGGGAGEERRKGRGLPPPVPSSSVRALLSPAELLMANGLVGPDALVEMAQDLLSPAASVEARKRTSRVLCHLWAASAAGSRLEVRGGQERKEGALRSRGNLS